MFYPSTKILTFSILALWFCRFTVAVWTLRWRSRSSRSVACHLFSRCPHTQRTQKNFSGPSDARKWAPKLTSRVEKKKKERRMLHDCTGVRTEPDCKPAFGRDNQEYIQSVLFRESCWTVTAKLWCISITANLVIWSSRRYWLIWDSMNSQSWKAGKNGHFRNFTSCFSSETVPSHL